MKRGVYWDWNPLNYMNNVDALVYDLTNKKAKAIYQICVDLSPVDTGAYRASWTISEGSPNYTFVGRQPRGSVLPKPPIPKISSKFYRKLYIANGSPYADLIERGYSPQAPAGVLKIAIRLGAFV